MSPSTIAPLTQTYLVASSIMTHLWLWRDVQSFERVCRKALRWGLCHA
jgi:hypothetical protein